MNYMQTTDRPVREDFGRILSKINSLLFGTSPGRRSSISGLKTTKVDLPANAERVSWMIVNQNTAVLYVKMAAGCTADDYDFILKAATGVTVGDGGNVKDTLIKDLISVFSASYKYNLIEIERP